MGKEIQNLVFDLFLKRDLLSRINTHVSQILLGLFRNGSHAMCNPQMLLHHTLIEKSLKNTAQAEVGFPRTSGGGFSKSDTYHF